MKTLQLWLSILSTSLVICFFILTYNGQLFVYICFLQKLPQLMKTVVQLSQKSQLLTKKIAKCNKKSIKHNCVIENDVKQIYMYKCSILIAKNLYHDHLRNALNCIFRASKFKTPPKVIPFSPHTSLHHLKDSLCFSIYSIVAQLIFSPSILLIFL